MSTRGRHGTQQVSAAYNAEALPGALDPITAQFLPTDVVAVSMTLRIYDV